MTVRGLIRRVAKALGFDVVRRGQASAHWSSLGGLGIRSVIDVGASDGEFARRIVDLLPDATVYAFEPLPLPCERLSKWAATTGGRVRVFNVALGEAAGERSIFVDTHHTHSSSFLVATAHNDALFPITTERHRLAVREESLDEFLARQHLRMMPETLVKLDVQGYEDRVIAGGIHTLKQARACILEVILDPLYEGQATFAELVRVLHDVGLTYSGNLEHFSLLTDTWCFSTPCSCGGFPKPPLPPKPPPEDWPAHASVPHT